MKAQGVRAHKKVKNHCLRRTTTEPDISKQVKTPPPGMTTSETMSLGWMMDGVTSEGREEN